MQRCFRSRSLAAAFRSRWRLPLPLRALGLGCVADRYSPAEATPETARRYRSEAEGRKAMAELVTLPGGAEVRVVGESYRQDELDRICGGRTETGHVHDCQAQLRPERDNPHDRHAVAVDIDGLHVGYLPRELAGSFGALVAEWGDGC
jgi:hypothetical protein